jgi:hypothetical protein
MVVAPAAGETMLKLWAATTQQLRQGVRQFPTGYLFTSVKMRPGLTFYRWAFQGIVRVNGRFVLVPQAWKLLQPSANDL